MVGANAKFMELSEELFDALIECQFQSTDFIAQQEYMTSTLPEPIYC